MWDLNGNIYEFADGYQLSDGVILIVKDNDAAARDDVLSGANPINAIYKSVLYSGALADLGTAGQMKFAAAGSIVNYDIPWNSGQQFKNVPQTYVIDGSTAAAPAILKELCIVPHDSGDYGSDYAYYTATGARVCLRGGSWRLSSSAGVFCVNLGHSLTATDNIVGARPAFYRSW